MNICLVHNEYGKFSGEEAAVSRQAELLKANGHEIVTFTRSSAGLEDGFVRKVKAFFSGIYNPFTRREFAQFLVEQKPDLVHVHNVFPLISPSILPECRARNIPVVMTLHNFRLICPNALLAREGQVCTECLGGREWRCVANNCESSFFKSLGYAIRTAVARKFRLFLDKVDVFICLTEFQRQIYIKEGFLAERCVVVPNFISVSGVESHTSSVNAGIPTTDNRQLITDNFAKPFVLYVGRVSPEKDVSTLVDAARKLPDIPFKIAGSYWRMPQLVKQAPQNVEFLGELPKERIEHLYDGAQMVVFATRCYEGFPAVILEAMAHARPVICSRIGGLPEIVEDHVHGLLYEPSRTDYLVEKIKALWADKTTCAEMGQKGRLKATGQYGTKVHYDLLMGAYTKAAEHSQTARGITATGRAVLGDLQIDGLTMRDALARLENYTRDGRFHYIFFCEGSILSNVLTDPELTRVLNRADMVLPDGIGAVMLGRIYGHKFPERIQGPRFMLEVFRESQAKGYRHFLYGGAPDVTRQLVDNLKKTFPGIQIAGSYSPPFRELTGEETLQVTGMIEKSGADLLWVALGSPRQEKWVEAMAGRIKVPVMLAVGAAFDFHAGRRPWAPGWIRALGLEWIFRMFTGGKRTFYRNFFGVMPGVSRLLAREFFRVRIQRRG